MCRTIMAAQTANSAAAGGDNTMLLLSGCCVIVVVILVGIVVAGWQLGWFSNIAGAPAAATDPMITIPDEYTTDDPPPSSNVPTVSPVPAVTGAPITEIIAGPPAVCPANSVGGFLVLPKLGAHWCCPSTPFSCDAKCNAVTTATGVVDASVPAKSRAEFGAPACKTVAAAQKELAAAETAKKDAAALAALQKKLADAKKAAVDTQKLAAISGGKEPNCPLGWYGGRKYWGSGANAGKCCAIGVGDGSDCKDPVEDAKCYRRKKTQAYGPEDPYATMGVGVIYDTKWPAPGFDKAEIEKGDGRKLCCKNYDEGMQNGGLTNGWCSDPYVPSENGIPDAAAHYNGTADEYRRGVWKGNLWQWTDF